MPYMRGFMGELRAVSQFPAGAPRIAHFNGRPDQRAQRQAVVELDLENRTWTLPAERTNRHREPASRGNEPQLPLWGRGAIRQDWRSRRRRRAHRDRVLLRDSARPLDGFQSAFRDLSRALTTHSREIAELAPPKSVSYARRDALQASPADVPTGQGLGTPFKDWIDGLERRTDALRRQRADVRDASLKLPFDRG